MILSRISKDTISGLKFLVLLRVLIASNTSIIIPPYCFSSGKSLQQ
ncbi:hypothetical protein RUMHYD_02655 [Blautia hydrogenotrophica DSM 10507]|uniref:Uncharacterized protein n=1 Tax=Blautia hydrogenotrophica (strain DSM 10507 / JCM 14656 / S5a33) TaxID=476272 RepID=C0CP54_BLAHS|nr:hypothetical protein RUMHYD_02655 [Blautia hydrogenotrophica DSM 10507]